MINKKSRYYPRKGSLNTGSCTDRKLLFMVFPVHYIKNGWVFHCKNSNLEDFYGQTIPKQNQ